MGFDGLGKTIKSEVFLIFFNFLVPDNSGVASKIQTAFAIRVGGGGKNPLKESSASFPPFWPFSNCAFRPPGGGGFRHFSIPIEQSDQRESVDCSMENGIRQSVSMLCFFVAKINTSKMVKTLEQLNEAKGVCMFNYLD